ncbi:MAG: hypothetical protein GZ085_10545 [Sulfuriferula multivorans]|uniref:Glycosyltransferase RgtA/B/C/D-like domain-containing protein n=1 Tax=Sulfuriferula multivorans TaxID=1559896 RepID=A0A7C9TB25_9PROT|nr:hypothetical protein [Sulfuriferula multivorans]
MFDLIIKAFKPEVRPFRVALALLFLASFLLTMWMAFFVPLYGDEPAWKLIGARLFIDTGKLLYFFPQCDAGQWIDIPLTWYPARLIDTWIYQDASNPWLLRNISWLLFCVLLTSWTAILHITSRMSLLNSGLFVTSFLSFGVLPFLMVFNRPEQSLLVWLTAGFCVMLWFEKHRVSGLAGKFLLTIFFGLLACLLAASHPKGLFFFPVVLLAWWRTVQSLPLGLGLLGIMALAALDTTHVWQARTACAESPWLGKIFQSLSLQPQQLWQNPSEFLSAGKANLTTFWAYVGSIQFQPEYQSMWLPATPQVSSSVLSGVLVNALTWLPLLVAATVTGLNLGRQYWRREAGWWTMALMLALSLGTLIFLQSNKNFYESSIVFPIVLLVCVFSFTRQDGAGHRILTHVLLPIMLVTATLSAYTRYDLFWGPAQTWQAERMHGPGDIAELGSFAKDQCNISAESENLILDLSTYHAFWQHRRPMFMPYVTGWWATGTNYVETLAKRNPGGLVTSCQGIPTEMTGIIKRSRGYCCASAVDLRQFSHP